MAHHELDELDEKILRLIVDNARIPFLEVARECGVSGAAIHQRVQKLFSVGVLKGSEFVVDAESIGYETCAFVGIFLTSPSTFDYVVKELEKIPEVVECYYTTGQYDLLIKVFAKNNKDLLRIIHTQLQPLGLSRTETLISFKDAFRKKIPIDFSSDD
ncbi:MULTISPECIES: Lrp/AsnC family transcriptional regulator [Proteiniphilum]|jgi:Lrp/AsnC family transcriptional regulator for asnA, asnC and gidA|uniref:Lrp/AsnC family transcriptional regulator n=1 Tax=Proteiniphilum TaxID=294702 RepID=UPI001EEC5E1E|nr:MULTISPECIES: Lrp/AsnC ligand binding domain-containing protein [Proteiniphilum]MDD2247041.1 Lrp/AsnC ligand binding domain-containing protein [Proteiniphilum sp.]MDD4416428.1 Lrp/AsnC ligand binding domain-containing protein [Proteiniphilum sp.]ULB35870.1 Lrp/AsnC ligand binding domain-containing protein [Proteiniphilum propionicum]